MSLLRDYAASLAAPTLPLAPPDAGYIAPYDEVVGPDGAFRPSWKGMAALAVDLTPDQLRRVSDEIAVLLADDGVTYGNPKAGPQPWRLDPMPLVLDAATWARLDVGLAQRAELLGALDLDLYGDQRMLAEGVIPAAAVFAHAGYVRPIARASGFDPHPLVLSSADLGRDAAGDWHVLADRVQAPSGLGYALENRRVISRVLPELFQEAGLHRLEPYFSALRASLLQSAPPQVADPRVVVLSPGTHSETAYDQAFLANVLGFPLVQGNDLVVWDGWVWMRPPRFPRREPTDRVDVILRRVDAEWCDPLEMRGNSRLGIAGLVEAVRRGRVQLVNGLGAGVLENPALMPFLAAACERLLGEQLRLPSVPTWWCGDAEGRERVLAGVDAPGSMIVRRIDGRAADVADLSTADLRTKILAEPHRFVGQQRLPLSQLPAWGATGRTLGQASPRQVVLRSFTIRDGSAYRPMVGGMATLVDDRAKAPTTKDVWVLKAAATDPDQGLVGVAAPAITRAVPVLAPRALEDMYWSGRYSERAEDLVRLVITTRAYAEQLDYSQAPSGSATLSVLHGALQRLCGRRWDDSSDELRSLLLDADRRGSAAYSLQRLRDALEGVRDQLSGDTWRAFTITDRAMRVLEASPHAQQIPESAGRMLTGILSLQGVTASMIRDAGWHMIEVGRYVERAQQMVTLLSAAAVGTAGPDVERALLEAMLMAAESSVTHRRRHRGDVRVTGVLALLLTDPDNPRSVSFSLTSVRTHLAAMPASTGSTRPERLLEHLEDALDSADIDDLAARSGDRRPDLARFLDQTLAHLRQLSDSIAQLHFESGPMPQPLSSLSLTELTAVGP